MWKYTGNQRPSFAIEPNAEQESVWDYPRPPKLDNDTRTVEVQANGQLIARSTRSLRMLETASPPTFYIPPDDVDVNLLSQLSNRTYCEWKGAATYWTVDNESGQAIPIGWTYENPNESFSAIKGYFCFYPSRVEAFVDGERVKAQASDFYGGWITKEIVGPFKGEPGTSGW